jgi:hypothetical protein
VYREAVNVLQRFGLVRPAAGAFPGVTIHRLVRWRAAEETNIIQEWTWFAAFVVSVCYRSPQVINPTRPKILVHLPPARDLASYLDCFSGDESIWAWKVITSLVKKEGKTTEFLRDNPHFHELRRVVQQYPGIIESIIQQAASTCNPQLSQMTAQDREQVRRLLADDFDGDVTLPPDPHQLNLSREEWDSISRVGQAAVPTTHQTLTNDR